MTGPAGHDREQRLSPAKRALLERLRSGRPGAVGNGPVPLRSGTGGPPVVLVHPVGGALFCYRQLTAALDTDVPVYGLAAEASDVQGWAAIAGLPAPERIPRLAERYIDRLHRAELPRPWVLAGWSFGGIVAYEMARQAIALVDRPDPAVLIDAAYIDAAEHAWTPEPLVRRWFVHDLARLAGVPPERAEISIEPPADATAAGLRADDQTGIEELLARTGAHTGLTGAELAQRYRIFLVNSQAFETYRPQPHDGPVTLVLADESPDTTSAWERYLAAPIHRHTVPGDHYGVMIGESARDVARIVDDTVRELAWRPVG